jgi:hypothetical protein
MSADQILSGMSLTSNAGVSFAAPETISAQGRFEDVHRGQNDPALHLEDMALGGAGEAICTILPWRPAAAEDASNGYCNLESEAVYGCTCCSRGLTSSKSITPFQ